MKRIKAKITPSTCENLIFDELWGEYKCKLLQIRIYDKTFCEACAECRNKDRTKGRRKARRGKERK